MKPTIEQQKALEELLQFCNIKELRLSLTTKVLCSEDVPICFDKKERQEFSWLYRFLESIDSKR